MTMMGSGGARRPAGADEALTYLKAAANHEDFTAKIQELVRREDAAREAEESALAAQQSALDVQAQANAAAEENARLILKIGHEREVYEARAAEIDERHGGATQILHDESERLKQEAARIDIMRQALLGQARTFEDAAAKREAKIAEDQEAATSALEAAMKAREAAETALADVHRRLTIINGAVAQLAD